MNTEKCEEKYVYFFAALLLLWLLFAAALQTIKLYMYYWKGIWAFHSSISYSIAYVVSVYAFCLLCIHVLDRLYDWRRRRRRDHCICVGQMCAHSLQSSSMFCCCLLLLFLLLLIRFFLMKFVWHFVEVYTVLCCYLDKTVNKRSGILPGRLIIFFISLLVSTFVCSTLDAWCLCSLYVHAHLISMFVLRLIDGIQVWVWNSILF